MHPLVEGIAHLQKAHDLVGEGMDHRYLEPEPEILHLRAEGPAFLKQALVARGQRMEALQKLRRGCVGSEHLNCRTGRLQGVARQVDAIDLAKILAAILQVIVDLQRRAERVIGRPGRGGFAMNVEPE
jgi:hypothetical protein